MLFMPHRSSHTDTRRLCSARIFCIILYIKSYIRTISLHCILALNIELFHVHLRYSAMGQIITLCGDTLMFSVYSANKGLIFELYSKQNTYCAGEPFCFLKETSNRRRPLTNTKIFQISRMSQSQYIILYFWTWHIRRAWRLYKSFKRCALFIEKRNRNSYINTTCSKSAYFTPNKYMMNILNIKTYACDSIKKVR